MRNQLWMVGMMFLMSRSASNRSRVSNTTQNINMISRLRLERFRLLELNVLGNPDHSANDLDTYHIEQVDFKVHVATDNPARYRIPLILDIRPDSKAAAYRHIRFVGLGVFNLPEDATEQEK